MNRQQELKERMESDRLDEKYEALREGVGFARLDRGVLRLGGKDRGDLLHRLSTADLSKLTAGGVATTIITSEKGRVIDMVDLLERGEEMLLVSAGNNPAEPLAWIDRYTIMDDVTMENVSDRYATLGLHGNYAYRFADEILGTGSIPPAGAFVRGELGDEEILAWRTPGLNGPSGLLLLGTEGGIASFAGALEAKGAIEIGPDLLEILRIEAGRPAPGSELGLQHNPLELGLVSSVSFTKGCYIGQEVIARLDSYDKVKNRLVGVRVQQSEGDGDLVGAAVRSTADGETVGKVTSAAVSPGIGTIALALVRATHATPDTPVEIVDAESRTGLATGLITHLPFAT